MASSASASRSADTSSRTAAADSGASDVSNPATAPDRAVNGTRVTDHHGRARTVKAGYLSVSETSFDRPGAPSPFGEDIEFPLPIDRLTFVPLSDEERS